MVVHMFVCSNAYLLQITLNKSIHHLIFGLGLQMLIVIHNDDIPHPTDRIISLDNVVGAWNDTKPTIEARRRKPSTPRVCCAGKRPGMAKKSGVNQRAANASYPEISSSLSG